MNWKNWLASIASAGLLAACGGGGGDAGSTPFGGGNNGGSNSSASVASLVVSLSKTSVTNTDTTPVGVSVTAVSSAGVVVAGAPISFQVSGGQLISSATATDASGKLAAQVDFSADKSNRVVTVTVKSGAISETRSFSVTGIRISTTAVPAIVAPGATAHVDVVVADASNAPISGLTVSASSPASTVAKLTESAAGTYRYDYTVPPAYAQDQFVITVTAAGLSQTQSIAVQQSGSTPVIPPASGTLGTTTLSIEPSVIAANELGSSANQATVRLTVFDNSGNPMPNVRVSFDENGTATPRGSYSTGTSVVYTNAAGIATTSYVPGVATTGPNALVLRACYAQTDFTPATDGLAATGTAACPYAQTQTGTIVKDAFNVTIGSNDKIEETSDGLRYVVKYVVQVVNASGQAKANVQITPTLDLLGYDKGAWVKGDAGWDQVSALPVEATYADLDNSATIYQGCRNEDVDRNGINAGGTAEDFDGDKLLEPRKSDAAISFIDPAQTKTDATGAVGLQVTYLKNVASWLRIKIYVTGAVSGTEGKGTFEEVLAVPATALSGSGTPAFVISPYGRNPSCTVH